MNSVEYPGVQVTESAKEVTVCILLATYNGASYLADQLDSILAQSFTDWRLTIRDDGSTDSTIEIINSYLSRYPEKITLLENDGENLGPCGNFARLLLQSKADYTMFCDQDDVWLARKIEKTFEEMQKLEGVHGKDRPLLVHSDLKVTDMHLQVTGESLWAYQQTDPVKVSLNRLLMQNNATGCTVMVNRALRDLALPIPVAARMHDWWLALVAGAFGRIGFIREPTVLYRQHGKNDSGAVLWDLIAEVRNFFDKDYREKAIAKRDAIVAHLQNQAAAFLQRYGERLSAKEREMVRVYSQLSEQGFFMRRYYTVKYGFFYANFLMNLGMLLFR